MEHKRYRALLHNLEMQKSTDLTSPVAAEEASQHAKKALWLLEAKVTLSMNYWKRLRKMWLQPNYPWREPGLWRAQAAGDCPWLPLPRGLWPQLWAAFLLHTPNQPGQLGRALALYNGLQN